MTLEDKIPDLTKGVPTGFLPSNPQDFSRYVRNMINVGMDMPLKGIHLLKLVNALEMPNNIKFLHMTPLMVWY